MSITNKAFKKLLEEHKGTLLYQCNRYKRDGVSFDDLYQTAMIGLFTAAGKFDPSRSVDFNTYLNYIISSSLRSFLSVNEYPVYLGKDPHWYGELVLRMRQILAGIGLNTDEIEEVIEFPGIHPLEDLLSLHDRDEIQKIKDFLHRKATSTGYKTVIDKGITAANISFDYEEEHVANWPSTTASTDHNILAALEIEDTRRLVIKKYSYIDWLCVFMKAQGYTLIEIAEDIHKLGFRLYTRQAIHEKIKKVQKFLKESKDN